MPSGLAYPGGIRSGGPKPGKKSAKETASKINKQKKKKKKATGEKGRGAAGAGAAKGPTRYIAGARLRRCAGWGGGRRAQAYLLSSAVELAYCSSLNTLNCGSQPLCTRARAMSGAVSWWLKPRCTSSFVVYPNARNPLDLMSTHSAKRWAAV